MIGWQNLILWIRLKVYHQTLKMIHSFWTSTFITVTSQWAPCRPKSLPSRLFAQQFVQTHSKENIKTPRHWPLWGESTGDRWFLLTKACKAEIVSIVFIWYGHVIHHNIVSHDILLLTRGPDTVAGRLPTDKPRYLHGFTKSYVHIRFESQWCRFLTVVTALYMIE